MSDEHREQDAGKTCDFWPNGNRCGKPAVERLVWLNPNIDSGSTYACADCFSTSGPWRVEVRDA